MYLLCSSRRRQRKHRKRLEDHCEGDHVKTPEPSRGSVREFKLSFTFSSGHEDFFPLSPSLLAHTCTQVNRDAKIFFPCPPRFSLTHARRCIGTGRFFFPFPLISHSHMQVYRDGKIFFPFPLAPRSHMHAGASGREDFFPFPPFSSLTHARRCIGPRASHSHMHSDVLVHTTQPVL
jgi:hypothetical protein